MAKKDIFIHGTLKDAVNWEEFFDPKNQGESFLEGDILHHEVTVPHPMEKRLAKTRVNPRPRQKQK